MVQTRGTRDGDWASLAGNTSEGNLVYDSGDGCSKEMCYLRQQNSDWDLSLAECGVDLSARGNHAAWWTGVDFELYGFTLEIISPSTQVNSTDVASTATGMDCGATDDYQQTDLAGGDGGDGGDCGVGYDPYEWWHWDGSEYVDYGEVCIAK